MKNIIESRYMDKTIMKKTNLKKYFIFTFKNERKFEIYTNS